MSREENTVHTEHTVVRLVTEIASVGQVLLTRLRVVVVQRLVHPVPDGRSAEEVGRFDGLPVVFQVTAGISHGVCVFRNVERIFHVVRTLHGLACPGDGRILVGTHIHDVVVPFVLYRAGRIIRLDGIVGSHEILARTGLVTQRPDDNRRMVDVRMHQFHHAGYMRILEFRHV